MPVVLPNLQEKWKKTLCLTYPHTENSRGVKSGDRGGQANFLNKTRMLLYSNFSEALVGRAVIGGHHIIRSSVRVALLRNV